MARNKMDDLRDHLFASIERLSDEELTPEQLDKEIKRAKAINGVAGQIIESAKMEVTFLETTGQLKSGSQFFAEMNPKQLPPKTEA